MICAEALDAGEEVLCDPHAGIVPIGTLEVKCQRTILRMEKNSVYSAFMSRSFGDTLKARMDAEEVSIADISRATGVSSDIVKKLRSREGSTTNVEDAAKLAAYFGQSVEDFMSDSPARRIEGED